MQASFTKGSHLASEPTENCEASFLSSPEDDHHCDFRTSPACAYAQSIGYRKRTDLVRSVPTNSWAACPTSVTPSSFYDGIIRTTLTDGDARINQQKITDVCEVVHTGSFDHIRRTLSRHINKLVFHSFCAFRCFFPRKTVVDDDIPAEYQQCLGSDESFIVKKQGL